MNFRPVIRAQRTRLQVSAVSGIFLLVALLACASTPKDKERADLHLRIGTGHLIKGSYHFALTELQTAEKLDPSNATVQNNLGLVYYFMEQYPKAVEHLHRAVKMAPDFSEARNNYARALIELTRFDEAIAELKKVLADLTYPEPAKTWVNMGLAYFRKGDYAAAENRFAHAIQLDRNHCLAQTYYGRSLLETGRLADAARSLDNAVVICKTIKFDEPHYFSGLTYYKLGKTTSAIARMEEVMQLYPNGRYAKKAESMLKLMK